ARKSECSARSAQRNAAVWWMRPPASVSTNSTRTGSRWFLTSRVVLERRQGDPAALGVGGEGGLPRLGDVLGVPAALVKRHGELFGVRVERELVPAHADRLARDARGVVGGEPH